MTTKNELGEAIVIERTLNAPVANVWQAGRFYWFGAQAIRGKETMKTNAPGFEASTLRG
jgi:hypothetical protein